MKIDRKWAMPNSATFTIKPIREILTRYAVGRDWIDPFAGYNSPAEWKNDLNPATPTEFHMDALAFLKGFVIEGCMAGALFDPPYSITQATTEYKAFGADLFLKPSSMGYWAAVKTELARLIKPGGYAICCGWSSMGLGKSRGFAMEEILLIPHGGSKNDTIVTVERKAVTE